ncbi:ABC transporter ATP-binding protein [Faecalibacterium sp. An192]|uniref:ABC transporter ATP-binding protein n=1 Tax=Faecalibacterium sp. An192 TaxID=1965581 RepID=UPI000B399FC5|nr:ABC transporter ATP-binding protein [Faecalibacterium sp. An192]OUP29886.1 multidrug ABC transporter permease [Faecalibacterium sp. An192]
MKQKSWISIVFSFASQCRGKIALSVVCAIISVAAGLVPYWSVYQVITLFIGGSPEMAVVWRWCWIGLGAYAVRFLLYGISTSLSHISAYTILENIRLALAQRLMKAPLGTVMGESVGKLKSVLVDRVETIELPLAHMIPECSSNLLLSAAVFIYLACIDWRMALAMLVTIPFALVAFAAMMKNFNKLYADYMESSNYVNGVIVEYVEGIEVIKAFNQSSSSYEKFAKAVQSFKDYTLKWYQSSWKGMNFITAVLPSTFLGTLPVGMYLYWKGTLAPQDLVICLILSLGIVGPLMNFTTYINETKEIEYAVHDVDKLLHAEELPDTGSPAEIQSKEIVLHNVSFSYDKESSKQALSHVDLKIPEGKFTALVGPSGGGKSTIARLIARFWDVDGGKITIGGTDIRNMPLSQLTDLVSFVTQDNFLFNCSIKENIRLGNPKASDEEVYAAAKAACCDTFIRELEHGYDTAAGDAGNRLSGGEKQRISIARMILKNAPIVILDEATAFTDQENEEKIQRSIAALTKGKTLLVIAHRLSTIKNADQIIVLQNGQVENIGTHQQLLDGDSLYRDMWQAHIGAQNWSASSGKGGN